MDKITKFVLEKVNSELGDGNNSSVSDTFDSLGVDSLEMMNIMSAVEEEYDMFVNYKSTLRISTINDLIKICKDEMDKKKNLSV